MDDQLLRQLYDRLQYLRNLQARKEEVKSSIQNQEKLTDELAAAIDAAATLAEVEDLYRPYKPKRRTRATIAREKDLEPLARLLFDKGPAVVPQEAAKVFVDPEKGVETVEDALQGASDIIAEEISDDADIRKDLRQLYLRPVSYTHLDVYKRQVFHMDVAPVVDVSHKEGGDNPQLPDPLQLVPAQQLGVNHHRAGRALALPCRPLQGVQILLGCPVPVAVGQQLHVPLSGHPHPLIDLLVGEGRIAPVVRLPGVGFPHPGGTSLGGAVQKDFEAAQLEICLLYTSRCV